MAFLMWPAASSAELIAATDYELSTVVARTNLPFIPGLDEVGFNIQGSSIELDLDIQASIDSIEYIDDDGVSIASGGSGEQGSLLLKGVHLGSSQSPISAERVRNAIPFKPDETAQIHGIKIQADTENGTLVTVNQIGDIHGNGLDVIVNDIYFGQDLSSEGVRGLGLLLEDVSNFVSDDYVNKINASFGLNLATIDDGLNTVGGNYYPLHLRMKPLQVTNTLDLINPSDLSTGLDDVVQFPSLGISATETSMTLDAQFVLYIDKIAIYKENWEAGIQGFMVYQGLDTTGDGIEDTIGPATLTNFKMQTIQHELANGNTVQAMHFSNIDFKSDIAMANIYIGNPETGSLGALHINDLHIHDTQMWIYPHDWLQVINNHAQGRLHTGFVCCRCVRMADALVIPEVRNELSGIHVCVNLLIINN